jgi:hypothetical protein
MGCMVSTRNKTLLNGEFEFNYEKLSYNDEYEIYQGIEFMCDKDYKKFVIKKGYPFQYIILVKQWPDIIFLSQAGVLSLIYEGKFLLNALDFSNKKVIKKIKRLDNKYFSENIKLTKTTKDLQHIAQKADMWVNKTRQEYISEPVLEGDEEDME